MTRLIQGLFWQQQAALKIGNESSRYIEIRSAELGKEVYYPWIWLCYPVKLLQDIVDKIVTESERFGSSFNVIKQSASAWLYLWRKRR